MGTVIQLWKKTRLERLREGVLKAARDIRRAPCRLGGVNPNYAEMGRLIYETATREYKPSEIPKALRVCPWIFVLAELAREFPDVDWKEQSLARYVQIYLETLQAAPQETLFNSPKTQGA